MEITSAQFIKSPEINENTGIEIVVNNVVYFVPLDPANTTYAEIMRQVEAGELTIQEADSE